MKAIILARVSTEEQKDAGNSLPAQTRRLKEYCQRKDLQVLQEFSFDESAYKTKRDEFEKLVEFVQDTAKNEKIAVCFDKVDRLSRNIFDERVATLYQMAKEDKIEIHFASDNQVLDSSTGSMEKTTFNMSLVFAEYFSSSISDSVKRANEQLMREGKYPSKAPLGYINTTDDNGNKDIIFDAERASLIKMIFTLYSKNNDSIKTIGKKMRDLGLRNSNGNPIANSTIHHILNNPFYYGEIRRKGKLYPHNYGNIISYSLFQQCQEVIKNHGKKKVQYAARPFIFRGLIKCKKCGCSITPEKHVKKNGKQYIIYSCTNYHGVHKKRTYVNEKKLLEPVFEALRAIQMPQSRIDELTASLKEITENENTFHKQNMKNLKASYDKYEDRISKLLDLLADGSITNEAYDKKVNEYKAEQHELLQQMQAHSYADKDFYLTAGQVFSLAKRAEEIFKSSEVPEKRQLLNYLLQNCTISGQKLSFDLAEPFNLIVRTKHRPITLPGSDSNRQPND